MCCKILTEEKNHVSVKKRLSVEKREKGKIADYVYKKKHITLLARLAKSPDM